MVDLEGQALLNGAIGDNVDDFSDATSPQCQLSAFQYLLFGLFLLVSMEIDGQGYHAGLFEAPGEGISGPVSMGSSAVVPGLECLHRVPDRRPPE
jgi:hypothetical protein